MEWEDYHKQKRAIIEFERRLPPDSLALFICGSFGDVFGVLLLLSSFIRYHKRPVVLIIDKKYEGLERRFRHEGAAFLFIESEHTLRAVLQTSRERFALSAGEIYPTLPTLHPLVSEAQISRRITAVEAWRLLLRLPMKAHLNLPPIDIESESRLQKLSNVIKTGGRRSVCFFVGSQSNTELPDDLYAMIISTALSIGYEVYVNDVGVPDQRLVSFMNWRAKFLRIEPAYVIEACELFDAVITPVSGVSALLCMISHKASVIVHRAEKNTNKVTSGDSFGYTLGCARDELEGDFIPSNSVHEVVWPEKQSSWLEFISHIEFLLQKLKSASDIR